MDPGSAPRRRWRGVVTCPGRQRRAALDRSSYRLEAVREARGIRKDENSASRSPRKNGVPPRKNSELLRSQSRRPLMRNCSRGTVSPSDAAVVHPRSRRAQGMPGCRPQPMARLQKKSRRQSPQVQPTSGIPCAMVFTLTSRSPRCSGLLATVAVGLIITRRLGISVGMPGPRDFTSAPCRPSTCRSTLRHVAATASRAPRP